MRINDLNFWALPTPACPEPVEGAWVRLSAVSFAPQKDAAAILSAAPVRLRKTGLPLKIGEGKNNDDNFYEVLNREHY